MANLASMATMVNGERGGPYDFVIKSGRIVDGSGMPGFFGDVAVQGGHVAAVGKVDGPARRTINAEGLVVAPGFIDHHTHMDAQIFWDPIASASSWHGVTSIIMANCGLGLAPCRPEDHDALLRTFIRVEAMPRPLLEAGIPWGWQSFAEYLAAFSARLGVNVGALAGHHPIRRHVLRDDANQRVATDVEVNEMVQQLRAALQAGALGLTTDRNPRHAQEDGSPLPGHLADDREVFALAAEVGRFGAGAIQAGGNPAIPPVAWYGDLSLHSGRPVLWQAINHRWSQPDQWRADLAATDEQFKRGARAFGLTFALGIESVRVLSPYTGGFEELPTWKRVLNMPSLDERKRALADPALRPQLRYEAVEDPKPTVFSKRWDMIRLAGARLPEHQGFIGKSFVEIAQAQGKDVIDAFLDLNLKEDLEAPFKSLGIQGDPEAVGEMLRSPHVVIGESDAGAHTQNFATYGYCTHLLGQYVRERGDLTLEEAVHRLTFAVATLYDIPSRGLLRPGYAADIVLFDPDRIGTEEAEWVNDQPAGYGRFVQRATGIEMTIVNGEVLMERGEHTGTYPGKLLRNAVAEAARVPA